MAALGSRQLWRSRRAGHGRAVVHGGGYGQSRTQATEGGGIAIEQDARGDTLYDLGEVPGRVFRREHAELSAGCRREARDTAAEHLARQYVGLDRGGQSWLHMGELAFLEIGVDPQTSRRHHGHQLRADRGKSASPRTAVTDRAVDRGVQFRVPEGFNAAGSRSAVACASPAWACCPSW